MKILIVGDICGRPGREAFSKYTPLIKEEHNIDIVIANGENMASGRGITKKTLDEIYRGGADIVTSGNHIWDQREIMNFIDDEPFLIRPANYPVGTPGRGYCIYPWRNLNIAVINLLGRVFMPPVDCPFQKIEEILSEIKSKADIIILDMHAEATSEKISMAYYLDGRVHAVVGTHTHIQTADERILPHKTAYITDLGMTGPYNSSLGINVEDTIKKFVTGLPTRFNIAEGPAVYSGVIIEFDTENLEAKKITRVLHYD